MPLKPFLMVVVDHDRKLFNILGPMTNDNDLSKEVVGCQKEGRRVNCFNSGEGDTIDNIKTTYMKDEGYSYTSESVLVLPSTRSSDDEEWAQAAAQMKEAYEKLKTWADDFSKNSFGIEVTTLPPDATESTGDYGVQIKLLSHTNAVYVRRDSREGQSHLFVVWNNMHRGDNDEAVHVIFDGLLAEVERQIRL